MAKRSAKSSSNKAAAKRTGTKNPGAKKAAAKKKPSKASARKAGKKKAGKKAASAGQGPARRGAKAGSRKASGTAGRKAAEARRGGARSGGGGRKLRYAVVGLGHIVQVAVLPAFAHARRNSELVALVSSDEEKLRKLGRKYGIDKSHLYDYDGYRDCLKSGDIDAVYLGLPNDQHRDFTLAAARAGIHVLCEKPMALDEEACREMIGACRDGGVRLMVAYRLHFERANLEAIELARSGKLGEVRFFGSLFGMNVQDEDNIRLRAQHGGGPLYDIGTYCINAARYVFGAEPEAVTAQLSEGFDERFHEVEEQAAVTLRFPGGRLASFVCSFNAADVSCYDVVGTKGHLRVDPAYEYVGALKHRLKVGERTRERTFAGRDQFAPELLHFSECVLGGREPEPNGREGLADVRVVQAILRAAREGREVRLGPFDPGRRPSLDQEIHRPPVQPKPEEIHASGPSG